MAHPITVSKELYTALQHQAFRRRQPVEDLVEVWLKQHLSLDAYPDLE